VRHDVNTPMQLPEPPATSPMNPTKLFISHASEDKKDFVEPLVQALRNAGFEVWYDKYELTLGDSLLAKIGEGLHQCDFGVVVLSPHFFRKKWPGAELDGLFALETAARKVILPIWKDVRVDEVLTYSPILAGRLGAPTTGGVNAVVGEIRRAVEASQRTSTLYGIENHLARFKELEDKEAGEKRALALANSTEGVTLAEESANKLLETLQIEVGRLVEVSSLFKITMETSHGTFKVNCPYRVSIMVRYVNQGTNFTSNASLSLYATQGTGIWEDPSKFDVLHRLLLRPRFDNQGTLIWESEAKDRTFTNAQLVDYFLQTLVDLLGEQQAKRSTKDTV
jgi:hypothetical protein